MADTDQTEEKQSAEVLERLRQLNVLCQAGVRMLLRCPATAVLPETFSTAFRHYFGCNCARVAVRMRFNSFFMRFVLGAFPPFPPPRRVAFQRPLPSDQGEGHGPDEPSDGLERSQTARVSSP